MISILHIAPVVDGVREDQWIAVFDNEIPVGRVSMREMDGPLQRCACIKQLWVDPVFRRRGIGRQLLEACITNAVAEECDVISLAVDSNNLDALPFYRANQFRVVAEFPNEIWMSRFIEPAPAPLFQEDNFTAEEREAILATLPDAKFSVSIESTPRDTPMPEELRPFCGGRDEDINPDRS
jgi:GNAT superfamily N-acetyltransferase